MIFRRPSVLLVALLVAAAATLAACGGDDDAGDTGTDTTQGSEEEDDAAEEPAGGETITVSTVDNSFSPSTLSLEAGTEVTVEVTNDGSNPHTFTIDDLQVSTGSLNSGESATVSFTVPEGGATYYCEVHGEETMSGSIDS